ncbi:AGCS family alanine or glycine:cation symporter [Prauserella isguenensis]|uniref:AGCS family alanine or glycine:cation symporter n=1 Tax=Prauserella isguenensis TaxID=1470180 RepID=A0A839RWN8_9PSEU|nr:alanine/glycine:cation symporter family protein [Prauserella isguenensis]MBB3049826.1 AGCS family alanine or glycine:cation symporter [Prauserella isguenensis]
MYLQSTAAAADPPGSTHILAADGGGIFAGVENWIADNFTPIADGLANFVFAEVTLGGVTFPWIVSWLILGAIVFTIYFGFIQVRRFKLATDLVRGKFTDKNEPGEINHFQALASALSGTVGLGNIAGVGAAVTIGGAGATFWMICAGLLAMASKFVECTLGVKYREEHEDGTVSGGPMYYLSKGIAERFQNGFGVGLGKVLAVLTAIGILFFGIIGGNMFQSNQAFAQIKDVTGGEDGLFGSDGSALVFGIILAIVIGVVIIGGIKSIANVTSRLVPTMGVLYIVACLVVILFNFTAVPAAIGEIISGAFTGEGVAGGMIGALIVGIQRSAFSNEAGLGSAPIAHSAVKTKNPATEGFVALLEPFIDTVIVCTMTALTIVIAKPAIWTQGFVDVNQNGADAPDGVTVTSNAFATVMPWFPYVLTVAVVLFAISTLITWGYYGEKAWGYLFGRRTVSIRIYQVLFCVMSAAGAVLTLQSVIDFADAVLFLLALFNITGLYLLLPVVKKEVKDFLGKIDSGEIKKKEKTEV